MPDDPFTFNKEAAEKLLSKLEPDTEGIIWMSSDVGFKTVNGETFIICQPEHIDVLKRRNKNETNN